MPRQIDAQTAPSLLVRIKDHQDALAWGQFTEVYGPLIYNYCRLRDVQPADASDITQEVFLRISRAIRSFEYDPARGLFRDWIARIIRNEIARKKTKQSKSPVVALQSETSGVEDPWNEHFYRHILEVAMDRCEQRFTPETWRLFKETWVEHKDPLQVSKELDWPVEKIYIARSRVLKQLRHEVALLADDA